MPTQPSELLLPESLIGADAETVAAFVAHLDLAQQIALISGPPPTPGRVLGLLRYNMQPFVAGDVAELGVGGIRFSDGPRGVVLPSATSFPAAIARGATWDPQLESAIGAAMGYEARALGANLIASVCINLLRHPGWGRAQETYGEDPAHLGAMGAAAVDGIQRHAMACVKHFAVNSIENSRFGVDVRIGPRALHEVYLPHFRRAVDAGAASVMSAYNRLNGTWCGHHEDLLSGILRGRWGFDGFVMSDFFFGVRDGPAAVEAGCDLEMPFAWRGGRKLARAVYGGHLDAAHVATAATNVLATQARFAARLPRAKAYDRACVAGEAHRALARRAAVEGMVLLKNVGGLLPLDPDALRSLALVGPLAEAENQGDRGSSGARPPQVVSVREGVAAALPPKTRLRVYGGRRPQRAAAVAARAQAAVVVVGLGDRDEGEYLGFRGGDRTELTLPRGQAELVRAVAAANPHTAVVLIGGSALDIAAWQAAVPAIVMAWYPGMEGGHAIADVLFGRSAPAGRLPVTFAGSASFPDFDPRAKQVDYDAFPGYRHLDRAGSAPAWPFGFGLSYGDVAIGDVALERDVVGPDDEVVISATAVNAGKRGGWCVVQAYSGKPDGTVARAPRELRGFAKVAVPAQSRLPVRVAFAARDLAVFDPQRDDFWLEPGAYVLSVGTANDPRLLSPLTLTVRG